jgi:nucleoside-diphosphate-sugar epimerase
MITGTGFLGSYAAAHAVSGLKDDGKPVFFGTLRQLGAISQIVDVSKVNLIKGDIMQADWLKETIKQNAVKNVIHTAGVLIGGARDNPTNAVKTNILGTLNLLEIARQKDFEKLVYTASGQAYRNVNPYDPLPSNEPLKEDAPVLPGNVYGTTKLACEHLGLNYANIYGIDFVSLRMPTVYGQWKGEMGRAGALRDMVVAAILKKKLEVNEYESEYSYVRDMANSCILAIKASNVKKGIYNVGSGRIDSLANFKAEIERQLGTADIIIKPTNQPKRAPMDYSKAKKDFGYEPKFGIREAIEEMISLNKTSKFAKAER